MFELRKLLARNIKCYEMLSSYKLRKLLVRCHEMLSELEVEKAVLVRCHQMSSDDKVMKCYQSYKMSRVHTSLMFLFYIQGVFLLGAPPPGV